MEGPLQMVVNNGSFPCTKQGDSDWAKRVLLVGLKYGYDLVQSDTE